MPGLIRFQPPRQPLIPAIPSRQQTVFLHPGHPDGQNILLALPAVDTELNGWAKGIHHETARTACAILAYSRWDGFLTVGRDGERVLEGPDEILLGSRYYFRILGDEKYPVVESFESFTCPLTIPASWQDHGPLTFIPGLGNVDERCRITASRTPTRNVRIIPQEKSDWWQRNNMFMHAANPDRGLDTSCAENAIVLRRDMQEMWDDHCFAIVRKAGRWVVHVLWRGPSNEFETDYQNLELQPLADGVMPLLFCRFAMAILSKSLFQPRDGTRRLVTQAGNGETLAPSLPAPQHRGVLPAAGSRANGQNQGPKKRQRLAPGNDDDDDDTYDVYDHVDSEEAPERDVRGAYRATPAPWTRPKRSPSAEEDEAPTFVTGAFSPLV